MDVRTYREEGRLKGHGMSSIVIAKRDVEW